MNYELVASAPEALAVPLLALGVPKQANKALPEALAELDSRSGGILARLFANGDFGGGRDETSVVYLSGDGPQRLLLVGVGKAADMTRSSIRRAAAVAARRARALGTGAVAFAMPETLRGAVGAKDFAQVAVEGMAQGAWQCDELKAPNDEKKPPVSSLAVVVALDEQDEAAAGFEIGRAIAEGQSLARRLQFLPPNRCTPGFLAETAQQLGKQYGFKVTVLDKPAMETEGMGALLAVNQGSATEPRFMTIEYWGAGDAPPVALVGKGITFDTGGISIKPAAQMEEMKYDMSGAAAVLGAMDVVGRLKPKLNVVGVIPSTDNMPSGTAIRPADVVNSHFGKTIEIVNTDAEGRLVLADALSYVRRFKPVAVLDAATLTGAAISVTGHVATPIMGNDEALVEEVRKAGDRAGERCWPLPMFDEFREQNKSDIADVKNSAGRAAGTITAGWFLREFVDGFSWVHLDVAGTAYTDSDSPPLPKGPAGVPTRLFAEFILGRAG
ncbi:MAG: leucyl aminopeptidase [Gemmatimonadetes bacterium]|nr:leucyl aminopeptidase [Gemmatimonadota bacterium]